MHLLPLLLALACTPVRAEEAVRPALNPVGPPPKTAPAACKALVSSEKWSKMPDWQRLFVSQRALWEDAHLVLFGHALLEKLVRPRKPITAHVYRAYHATQNIVDLDAWVAPDLSAAKLATKPFAHLPVLGVPGWWAANEDPAFYADASVFRQPRCASKRQNP